MTAINAIVIEKVEESFLVWYVNNEAIFSPEPSRSEKEFSRRAYIAGYKAAWNKRVTPEPDKLSDLNDEDMARLIVAALKDRPKVKSIVESWIDGWLPELGEEK